MVRIAFKSGWLAAGGNAPKPQKVFALIRPRREIPLEDDADSIETDIPTPKEPE